MPNCFSDVTKSLGASVYPMARPASPYVLENVRNTAACSPLRTNPRRFAVRNPEASERKALGIGILPTLRGATARSAHDASGGLDVKPQQKKNTLYTIRLRTYHSVTGRRMLALKLPVKQRLPKSPPVV
jgi:hypothetical protein